MREVARRQITFVLAMNDDDKHGREMRAHIFARGESMRVCIFEWIAANVDVLIYMMGMFGLETYYVTIVVFMRYGSSNHIVCNSMNVFVAWENLVLLFTLYI